MIYEIQDKVSQLFLSFLWKLPIWFHGIMFNKFNVRLVCSIDRDDGSKFYYWSEEWMP